MTTRAQITPLAYDDQGSGIPVVLLHGLTFDRTTWSPVIEQLGAGVRTLAIDLPGHGGTREGPRSVWDVADLVHGLVGELGIDRPVVVGHSMSAAIAALYGARYPVLGVVNVDQPIDIRPFAQLVQRIKPALTGPAFEQAFEPFQRSMGFDLVPEPMRSQVLAAQAVRQDVVLDYWDEVIRTDPEEMHARIEAQLYSTDLPYLAVFGRALTAAERDHMFEKIPSLQLEEWAGCGHFVHLAALERFTARLRAFVGECSANAGERGSTETHGDH